MDAETNEQTSDHGAAEAQQSEEKRPVSQLRDLKPEKDPMGAGIKAEPQISVRDIKADAD